MCVFLARLCEVTNVVVSCEKLTARADCPWRFSRFVQHTHQLVNAIPARMYIVFTLLPRLVCDVYKSHVTSVCGYCLADGRPKARSRVCVCVSAFVWMLHTFGHWCVETPSIRLIASKPKGAVVSSAVFVWVVSTVETGKIPSADGGPD